MAMQLRISLSDYNADWVYKGTFQIPRSHPGYLTREELVEFYGTLGVDGIEFTHSYWGDCKASYARELASDNGLPVVCYVFGADLTRPPETLSAAVDDARRLLDRTAELGAGLCMITPGEVKPGVPLSEQRKWMINGLRACAEHALNIGVTACIENLDYPPCRLLTGRGSQCRDICAEVDSPGLRLIFDCGATLLVDEDAVETLRAMSPYVAHVHVKNSRLLAPEEHPQRFLVSDAGHRYMGTVLDGGAARIDLVLEELKRRNYAGFLLVEYQGEDDPRPACQHNVDYLRTL